MAGPFHTGLHGAESKSRTANPDARSPREMLRLVMLKDREALSRRLDSLERGIKQKRAGRALSQEVHSLEERIRASAEERERRLLHRPRVTYPENLPITAESHRIIEAIREHQVVIIAGETGSGKSTQIPKMCIEAGQGIAGMIGCTQPRRIAATTISRRIAQELGEETGQSVGYKIRFRDKTPAGAYIKVMTDGILLAETQQDPRLYRYDTLMVDEAHERSLNIDFILGFLQTLLPVRPELRVIITSATLDTEKFTRAFPGAPVVNAGGRMYPVEVRYMPMDPEREDSGDMTYVDMAVRAVDKLWGRGAPGDILVFMPTEQDILETCERIRGRAYSDAAVLPLFARLPASEQGRVYSVKGRKIVVATNVAETSLTIPGIVYVIDTGLARISRYLPSTRTTSLPISPISQSSADQRKGRCGRVRKGICVRLYSREDYESREQFTPPEILRSNLAEVILRMLSLRLGDVATFPFVDRPGQRSIKDGFDTLMELEAIARKGKDLVLTDKGRLMARMPMDPRISRMILEARKEGCVREVAIIASALSIQDPRERPPGRASEADRVHAPFRDSDSDFLTLLNIWNRYQHTWGRLKTQNKMRGFCREHFLSFPRMREWIHIHEQVTHILREQKIPLGARGRREMTPALYAGIHRAILSGYLSNIAVKKEKNIFQSTRGREIMVFPGSTLFNRAPQWIVAAEVVKTSRLFARTVARIDVGWLEELGKNLCRSSYSGPHWEKSRGEVRAWEQVSLFGLMIVPRRSVSYGPVNPEEAHDIFIRSALVEGEVRETLPFLSHNQDLIKRLESMEDKVRRRDILVSPEALADFYSRRLQGVRDMGTLKKRIKERGGDKFLKLREDDLIRSLPDEAELELFPDSLTLGDTEFGVSYKFAPGREEDGATVSIPASLVSRIPPEHLEWGVPGLFREKITSMIKGLPKRYRKQLVPVTGTVELILNEMERQDRPLLACMSEFVYRRFGVDIPASVWASVEIPQHLKMRVAVTDPGGRALESGRDIRLLGRHGKGARAKDTTAAWRAAQKQWERSGIVHWDFGPLPETIALGPYQHAYPALTPEDSGVSIRLFSTREEALKNHREGVRALFCLSLGKDLKYLKRSLKLSEGESPGSAYFGGPDQVVNDLYEGLLRRLLCRDIRTPEAFAAHAESVKSILLSEAGNLKAGAIQVLDAYRQTRSTLQGLEHANRGSRAVLSLCAEIRHELDALVPGDFLHRYSEERLAHIPRYLKAMQIRAERGAHDPGKDQDKAARVAPFANAFRKMRDGMNLHATAEKREAMEAVYWMIEEYKVSLFAQELKTPLPVSAQRIEKRMKEIERMV